MWAAVCLVGVGAGHSGRPHTPPAAGAPQVATTALQPGADPAVLPVRTSGELRAATPSVQFRSLLLIVVATGLLGLLAARWRRSVGPGCGRRPPYARHHTNCLRAPPLLQFA